MDNSTAPTQSRKISSSPRFPAMSLPTATEKARIIWDKEAKHAARLGALAVHWGFSEKSSSLRSYIAAMAHFGLMAQVGGQGSGEFKLTDRAIAILAGDSMERTKATRDAALQPRVYKELWQRFNGNLPSDENLESRLVIDFHFNRDSVGGFIRDFRATMALAKMDNEEDGGGENEKPPFTPPKPQPDAESLKAANQQIGADKGQEPLATTKLLPPMTANLRYLPIPLDIGDAPIPVGMSSDDFDLLLETLKLWKKKIVRSEYPKQAIWKNKDTDMPVTITGIAGERDGVTFYRASTGTGIPGNELEFQ